MTELGDNDPLLAGLLDGDVEARRDAIADLLSEHALPIVERILLSRLVRIGADARVAVEDLRGDVVVRLLHRLERLVENPAGAGIRSFRDYVAVVAYHRFDDFVRSTQPVRAALGNRVRYLLGKDPQLAVWNGPHGEPVAGFAAWREQPPVAITPLISDQAAAIRSPGQEPRALGNLLKTLLNLAGGPLELSSLVSLLAVSLRLIEVALEPAPSHWVAPSEPDVVHKLETQGYLRRLWREIVALPLRQRIALLLNLRDANGDSVARLLPLTGVATVEEIGRLVEIDAADFRALWLQLPIDDRRISELLGSTRQQVINLRKSARERLARRMARVG